VKLHALIPACSFHSTRYTIAILTQRSIHCPWEWHGISAPPGDIGIAVPIASAAQFDIRALWARKMCQFIIDCNSTDFYNFYNVTDRFLDGSTKPVVRNFRGMRSIVRLLRFLLRNVLSVFWQLVKILPKKQHFVILRSSLTQTRKKIRDLRREAVMSSPSH